MRIVRQSLRHALVRLTLASCLVGGVLIASAAAHPGSGIVVDRQGLIYFLDTGRGVWKLDPKTGKLEPHDGPPFHWMAIDPDSRFKGIRFPSTGSDLKAIGENPTLIASSDFPIAMGPDGALYYPASGSDERVQVTKITPDKQRTVLATLPATSDGGPLKWLNGMTAGPDGSIYYTENKSVRKIDPKGTLSTVAANVSVPKCAPPPSYADAHLLPNLRGLAVAGDGTVYVAASGCAALLKIAPGGKVTTILHTTPSPWTPTGVAVSGDTLYVLEYLHNASEDRASWVPRIRKITSDGKDTLLATVSR